MQAQINFLSLLLLSFTLLAPSFAATQPVLASQPPAVGNFSLSSSQQPSPFFSFGQNIIDKHQFIVSFNPGYVYSFNQSVADGISYLLYGITDSSSVLLTLPYAFNYKNGKQDLSGIGDLAIDLEYAFYNHENSKYSDQATLIFSPTLPVSNLDKISKTNPSARISGFARKNTPTSFNAATYFIGSTYARILTDWYGFLAPGILMIDKHDSIQQGTQYYYNLGIGRNIKSVEKKYLFLGLLEFNGQYSNKTKLASIPLPNTGGNIMYATPSLWFSTPKIIVQIGISLPIFQHWNGNQSNISYYASGIITWTIH